MTYKKEFERWLHYASDDVDLIKEFKSMDEKLIEDSFYCDLSFGTGGLRGIIGAGTNRMNVFTVAKASQGVANYLNQHFEVPSIAVSYDSRINSELFAKKVCEVFVANGIKVWLYPCLMPTPCLSYAVRSLKCSAGIMVTASHNPSNYNGYKVYNSDGCQITMEEATKILAEINKIDIFEDVKTVPFLYSLKEKKTEYIPDRIYDDFTADVLKQSVLYGEKLNRDVSIVYSPLNGTGLKPVIRVLQEAGFTNVTVVDEQAQPDGNFPTCPCPNPEMKEAMQLGLQYCEKYHADLLLATDPDCDRCGIAVKGESEYQLITGNEIGLLLLDYVCSQRQRHGKMPEHPVFVKTIVTTDLAEKIAKRYSVQTVNVLTGFKFIGEVIGKLEKDGREKDFICGFEESYGYLTGSYVRDKDAVNAALMICEMFSYYKNQGSSLLQKLSEIYEVYGYCRNTLYSYTFNGLSGMREMNHIMTKLRMGVGSIGGQTVKKTYDYQQGIDGLPKSNVLRYVLADGCSIVIRPSGTEPKLKIYLGIVAADRGCAEMIEQHIVSDLETRI